MAIHIRIKLIIQQDFHTACDNIKIFIMKKWNIIILIAIAVFFESCNSSKSAFVKSGDSQDDAIRIAIIDFAKNRKLFEKDSVFSVELIGIANNDELMVVRIGKNNRKLLLTKDTKIGSKGKLPSRHFEKDGRLFYWWDDNYGLTENTLAAFNKYHLLQDDKNGTITIPDFITEDTKRAAHYYFCKSDVSRYKRIITNKGIGYYESPSVNCSHKKV
jgi:hypothetical protein